MRTPWPKSALVCVLLITGHFVLAAGQSHDLAKLERSFWLHASLAAKAQKGYWGPGFPPSPTPSEQDIQNAAKLLTDTYAANRLYLVYHKEIPLADTEHVFRWWRQHCPEKVTLIPTLVLRMYDKQQTPVFTPDELRRLAQSFKQSINAEQLAVYDVYPNRDQGEALKVLAEKYPKGLIRVGIQPDENIGPPFVAAVQETWSGFCHGKTNADWLDRGFGAETMRNWVTAIPSHDDAVLVPGVDDSTSTALGGIGLVLSTSLFDGWLAITMPFYAFVGTWIGLAVGLLVRLVILRPILRRTAAGSPP